jgi:hypothetical protein
MPPKLREQPKLIQSPLSAVESVEQTQSTMIGRRRKMVPAVQEQEKKDTTDEDEERKEKGESISPEPSMDVDEVIETLRLEDELVESGTSFVADIPLPIEEDGSLKTPAFVEALPTIEELPQTKSEEISMQLNQLETVPTDQPVDEQIPESANMEVQSLQVSSVQPAPIDSSVTEEVLPSVTVENEPPTLVVQAIEEPFDIMSSKVVDYIPIPPSKTDSDEQKPEAIIVTEEVTAAESITSIEGKLYCCIKKKYSSIDCNTPIHDKNVSKK